MQAFDLGPGSSSEARLSPRTGLVLGPWRGNELFVQGAASLQGDDDRGVSAREEALELGLRTTAFDDWTSTLSLFSLASDDEPLFADAEGATERRGVSWSTDYAPADGLALDLALSASRARLADARSAHAFDRLAAIGATAGDDQAFASLRGRWFGPRAATADGLAQRSSSLLVDAHAGWRISEHATLRLSALNLFDRGVSDVDSFDPSRLPGEPVGPEDGDFGDVRFHPAEARSFRISLDVRL